MKNRYRKGLLPCVMSAVLLFGCAGADMEKKENNSDVRTIENSSGTEEQSSSAETVFEGKDMEGNPVSADIFSESILTMVNVWATYCSPCLSEMPELGELAEEYDPEEFQIIGIVSNVPEGADEEKIELVEVLIGQTGADYPHLLLNQSLNDGLLAGVTAVPTTFFFDQEGKLLDTVVGAREKADWKEMIDDLLEK